MNANSLLTLVQVVLLVMFVAVLAMFIRSLLNAPRKTAKTRPQDADANPEAAHAASMATARPAGTAVTDDDASGIDHAPRSREGNAG